MEGDWAACRVHAAMYRAASMAWQRKGGAVEWWLEQASQTLFFSLAPNPFEPIQQKRPPGLSVCSVQCAVCSGEKTQRRFVTGDLYFSRYAALLGRYR
jgi:hypothetical protein